MSRLQDAARRFRQELLAGEKQAASDIVQAYGQAWQAIKSRIDALTGQVEEERQAGREVSSGWLFQLRRLQDLQSQAEEQIRRFAFSADQSIHSAQANAVQMALAHGEALIRSALERAPQAVQVVTSFTRLPVAAVQDLVGFLSNGSPLRVLLDQLPGEGGQMVREKLITGVATGQSPRMIASQTREALGGQLTRALTISRTEVIRAYRESSRRGYEANAAVVDGWIWVAGLGPRCCAACVAMNGTFHTNDEQLDGHPRCRCVMVPHTKTWEELHVLPDSPAESRPVVEGGADWFGRQPEGTQLEILGPGALAAYQSGQVTLEDFVGRRNSEVWGTMRYTRSLADALAAAQGRRSAD